MLPLYLRMTALSSPLLLAAVCVPASAQQTIDPAVYGASASSSTASCSGQATSTMLYNCQVTAVDWKRNQGVHVVGAGPSYLERIGLTPSQFTIKVTSNNTMPGSQCYIAALADPFGGISPPSAPLCIAASPNAEPGSSIINNLTATTTVSLDPKAQAQLPPAPPQTFLWYESSSGEQGPYNLFYVNGVGTGLSTCTNPNDPRYCIDDFGQGEASGRPIVPHANAGALATLPSRGGWPTGLMLNPATQVLGISKNDDLFGRIVSVSSNCVVNGRPTSNYCITIGPSSVTQSAIASHPGVPYPDVLDPTNTTYTDPAVNYTFAHDFTNAMVLHDDTQAVQTALNVVSVAGGGEVLLEAGQYNIERPIFQHGSLDSSGACIADAAEKRKDPTYPCFTSDSAYNPSYAGFGFLQIPNGSVGNVHIAGAGTTTVIQTPPDEADEAVLLLVGAVSRPDSPDHGGTPITINPIAKGSNQVTFPNGTSGIRAGDDVWLFAGIFASGPSQGCPLHSLSADDITYLKKAEQVLKTTNAMTAGESCHYSELNTIASISGSTATLAHPASINFQPDPYGSAFGLVNISADNNKYRVPHNIALTDMSINTYDRIFGTGIVYGFLVNAVDINGYISGGAFSGGYKRDVTLQNSYWGVGRGDAGYSSEEEFDQFTNLRIINNAVWGFAPTNTAGNSTQARLYATEGTSQVTYYSNSFNYVSVYFDQTTDDYIYRNNFYDSIVNIGVAGASNTTEYFNHADYSYLSFGSQAYAAVTQNQVTIDGGFPVPWLVRVGHFDGADVTQNMLQFNGNADNAVIIARSGTISNNAIVVPSSPNSPAIVAIPDIALLPDGAGGMFPASPWSNITVQDNMVQAPRLLADTVIVNPGYSGATPVCVIGDSDNGSAGPTTFTSGQAIYYDGKANPPASCY